MSESIKMSVEEVPDGSVTRQKINNSAYSTSVESQAGVADNGIISPLRLVDKLKYDGLASARSFGILGDGSNQTALINSVLSLGKPIYFPEGNYACFDQLVVPAGGGIIGCGEKTRFVRNFSAGKALISYVGNGGDVGQQPWLRRFAVTTAANQFVGENDNGIEIGIAAPWGGRGEIADITIVGQFDGFKWKGGSVTSFSAIRCYDSKRHGFFGVNPRGELLECHAEYSGGNGYYILATNPGETGVRLINCGTFCSQEFGLQVDASIQEGGANIWLIGRFSSSFDGRGGIHSTKPIVQFLWDKIFIEYSGYSRNFRPAFADYPDAKGVTLAGPRVERIAGSDIEIYNCRGQGILVDNADIQLSGVTKVANNGRGLGVGADRVGVGIQNGARVFIQSLYTEAHKASVAQSTDLAINTPDCVVEVGETDCRAVYNVGSPVSWVGRRKNLEAVTIPSASTLLIPGYAKRVTVTGGTNINAATPTWPGHEIVVYCEASPSISNGNNLRKQSLSAEKVSRWTCDGTNWWISS
ncbi:hypothetical protein [Xanthomonas sp. WHRI 7065]|uniref:hypothetical protein n=1 Tax=Xanthomonas sp. WHRI 7065 TaxID=3161569 RepID=UPI0032E8E1F0